jgi:hypothetical protein
VSRLSPALAHRLDRLARRAHAFHRWSHHPLCAAYAGEVVRLGRRARLCRGCTLLALGGAAGLALGLAWPAPPGPSIGWTEAGVALSVLALLCAAGLAHRRGAHRSKFLTRFVPMAAAVGCAAAGLRAGTLPGLVLALGAAGLVGAGVAHYRRRGPDRQACQGCPQGPPGPRCDGLRPLAHRERAFQRLAGRLIDAEARAERGAAPWLR